MNNATMNQSLISIVIPVYNQTDTVLKSTLNSVLKQTYQNLEIWVVDDGSDRDMFPIVKERNTSDKIKKWIIFCFYQKQVVKHTLIFANIVVVFFTFAK